MCCIAVDYSVALDALMLEIVCATFIGVCHVSYEV